MSLSADSECRTQKRKQLDNAKRWHSLSTHRKSYIKLRYHTSANIASPILDFIGVKNRTFSRNKLLNNRIIAREDTGHTFLFLVFLYIL